MKPKLIHKSIQSNTNKVVQFFINLGCTHTTYDTKHISLSSNELLFNYDKFFFYVHVINVSSQLNDNLFKFTNNEILKSLHFNKRKDQTFIIRLVIDFSKVTPTILKESTNFTKQYFTKIIYRNEFKGLLDTSYFNDTGNRIFSFLEWLGFLQYKKINVRTHSEKNLKKIRDEYYADFNPYVSTIKVRNTSMNYFVTSKLIKQYSDGFEEQEPDTLDWIDSFSKGSAFYDIGASTGPFSLYAAIKSKVKVVSFEPGAKAFSGLEMNHYINRKQIHHPFITLNLAIGKNYGLGKLYIDEHEGGGGRYLDSTIKRWNLNNFDPIHVQFILRESIDGLILRYKIPLPNYIKIDVDGAELDVLYGSIKTLSNPHLKSVLIELNEKDPKTKRILNLMKKLNYAIKQKNQVIHYKGIHNYLFVKSSKSN